MTKRAGRQRRERRRAGRRAERRHPRRLPGRQDPGFPRRNRARHQHWTKTSTTSPPRSRTWWRKGREALFDAEHFFDGYKANPGLRARLPAGRLRGRRALGRALRHQRRHAAARGRPRSPREVIASGIPGDHLGIHTHDDTGNAVANTLAAVDAGARQIQGTLNGLGERCGNANLITLIPTLLLKEPYASRYRDRRQRRRRWPSITHASRLLDDILNRVPNKAAPYVGASAFAHKAGLHASAILKDPSTYEHIDPAAVGNARIIPMSNQAGQSNLRARLTDMGLQVDKGDPGAGPHPGRRSRNARNRATATTPRRPVRTAGARGTGPAPRRSSRSNATA